MEQRWKWKQREKLQTRRPFLFFLFQTTKELSAYVWELYGIEKALEMRLQGAGKFANYSIIVATYQLLLANTRNKRVKRINEERQVEKCVETGMYTDESKMQINNVIT